MPDYYIWGREGYEYNCIDQDACFERKNTTSSWTIPVVSCIVPVHVNKICDGISLRPGWLNYLLLNFLLGIRHNFCKLNRFNAWVDAEPYASFAAREPAPSLHKIIWVMSILDYA